MSIFRLRQVSNVSSLFSVPFSVTLLWFLLDCLAFYHTGHQPTFPHIQVLYTFGIFKERASKNFSFSVGRSFCGLCRDWVWWRHLAGPLGPNHPCWMEHLCHHLAIRPSSPSSPHSTSLSLAPHTCPETCSCCSWGQCCTPWRRSPPGACQRGGGFTWQGGGGKSRSSHPLLPVPRPQSC